LLPVTNVDHGPSDQAVLQFATGNMQTQLNFVLTTGRGKVVASPTVTTFANVPALFTANSSRFISKTFIGPTGRAQTTDDPASIPAMTSLIVTPRINGDNMITVNVQIQLQDMSGKATSPDGTNNPILLQQNALLTRTIRNGETMVLARLVREQDLPTGDRVPLIGLSANDTGTLVFITATIVSDPTTIGSAATTGELKAPAPGHGNGL
jgi:type II secretory pathway component HofQ